MSAPPEVRPARAGETATAARVLTDAFEHEDGLNYWLRQGAAKQRARASFFDAAVRDLVHKDRELWLAEADGAPLGAAIWLKPGDHAFAFSPLQEILTLPRFYSVAGLSGMQRARDLGQRMADLHPKPLHAHLVFIGVTHAAQGRGLGSAMLKHTLAPLDERGVIAYLECTTARKVALYQRHGFDVSNEFELPGLHMWTMTRQPRG